MNTFKWILKNNNQELINLVNEIINSYNNVDQHEKFLELITGFNVIMPMIDLNIGQKIIKKDKKLSLILEALFRISEICKDDENSEFIKPSMELLLIMWKDYKNE